MQFELAVDEMLINAATAGALVGFSAKTWARWASEGIAPEGKFITPTDKRWKLSEVKDFLNRLWADPSILNYAAPRDMAAVRGGKKRGRPRTFDIDHLLEGSK